MKADYKKWMRAAGAALLACQLAWGASACSESDDEDDNEYANWEERNEAYLDDIVAQWQANSDGSWKRLKSTYKDQETEGARSDYVYVQVVQAGSDDGASPIYTDSVRVSYQGRLIPSKTYPEGYVFDGTVYGTYDSATNATYKTKVSSVVDGWTTALQHMHRGDYWRLYIPYQMGYGASGDGSTIPGYSVLIFDLTLLDFAPSGEALAVWSARRR